VHSLGSRSRREEHSLESQILVRAIGNQRKRGFLLKNFFRKSSYRMSCDLRCCGYCERKSCHVKKSLHERKRLASFGTWSEHWWQTIPIGTDRFRYSRLSELPQKRKHRCFHCSGCFVLR
jgi:hypothetical protein